MQLKFNLSDQVYEDYVLRFGVQGTYQRMRKVLEEMQGVDPADRYFIVAGDDRRAVEKVFQTTIGDSKQLARAVERLNAVSIEGTKMEFTSEELERIRMQATFHGKVFEQFLEDMVAEIKGEFLNRI
jgi:hypothetical protein